MFFQKAPQNASSFFCQTQSVQVDENRTQAHAGGGDHRGKKYAESGEENPCGNGDPDDVIKECPKQVFPDDFHGTRAEFYGVGDTRKAV